MEPLIKLGDRTGIGGKNPRLARWRPGCPTDRARQAFLRGWTGNRAALAAHIGCTNDEAKKLLSALQTRREIEGTPGDKYGSIYRAKRKPCRGSTPSVLSLQPFALP